MRGNRLRWGALGWVLTLQFFVLEAVTAARFPGYSYAGRVISDLGSTASPLRSWMNTSFIVQGALIGAGVAFLLPAIRTFSARVASVLLGLAAVGVLAVGVFPEDGAQHGLHVAGAALYLVGGALGLLALAYAVRSRSELLGSALALLGLVGAAGTVFWADAITGWLGEGGTERVAAYVLPVGLALSGAVLGRLAGRTGELPAARRSGRPSRREVRAQAHAAEAERARERDAALESALRARGTTTAREADDDFDPDDPWAPTRRDR